MKIIAIGFNGSTVIDANASREVTREEAHRAIDEIGGWQREDWEWAVNLFTGGPRVSDPIRVRGTHVIVWQTLGSGTRLPGYADEP